MKRYLVTETRVYSVFIEAPNWGEAEEMFNNQEYDPYDTCNDYSQTVVTLNGVECDGDEDEGEDDDPFPDYYTQEDRDRYKAMSLADQITELNRIIKEYELAETKERN